VCAKKLEFSACLWLLLAGVTVVGAETATNEKMKYRQSGAAFLHVLS